MIGRTNRQASSPCQLSQLPVAEAALELEARLACLVVALRMVQVGMLGEAEVLECLTRPWAFAAEAEDML